MRCIYPHTRLLRAQATVNGFIRRFQFEAYVKLCQFLFNRDMCGHARCLQKSWDRGNSSCWFAKWTFFCLQLLNLPPVQHQCLHHHRFQAWNRKILPTTWRRLWQLCVYLDAKIQYDYWARQPIVMRMHMHEKKFSDINLIFRLYDPIQLWTAPLFEALHSPPLNFQLNCISKINKWTRWAYLAQPQELDFALQTLNLDDCNPPKCKQMRCFNRAFAHAAAAAEVLYTHPSASPGSSKFGNVEAGTLKKGWRINRRWSGWTECFEFLQPNTSMDLLWHCCLTGWKAIGSLLRFRK